MKKTIIMGVMLSCFLLLVTPCINAIEYKEVREEVMNELENRVVSLIKKDFEKLKLNFFKIDIINKSIISLISLFFEIYLTIAIFFVLIIIRNSIVYRDDLDYTIIEIIIACIQVIFIWPFIVLYMIMILLDPQPF
jgi:hypothetical protein